MAKIQEVCKTEGCNNLGAVCNTNYNGVKGLRFYRPWCGQCHNKRTAAARGLPNVAAVRAANAGFSSVEDHQAFLAKEHGFDNWVDYQNSMHPYRKFRKTYCENIDGRLGFNCNYEIQISAQLQVDHIDGNPSNNTEENTQTLCANCHTYKSITNKDYASPGRKALGIAS